MRSSREIVVVAVLVASPVGGHADPSPPGGEKPPVAKVTPFDLAAGRVPAPDPAKIADLKLNNCDLSVSGNVWTFDRAQCTELAAAKSTTTAPALTVQIAPGEPLAGEFAVTGGTVQINTKPQMKRLALRTPQGWVTVDLTSGATQAPVALAVFSATTGPADVWGLDSADKVYELSLGPPRKDSTSGACPAVTDAAWCPQGGAVDDKLICIDATDEFKPVVFDPRSHILRPNQSLAVYVRHRGNQGVEIKMQGTRGLYEPRVADYTGGLLPRNEQMSGAVPCDSTTHGSFAPRTPGSADVKIELRDIDDPTKVIASHTIELDVDTTYVGAIRLGFSSVFGKAVDRAYAEHTAPGSSTREIASTETGDVNIEAIVSISAYLIDLVAQGGRTYASRPTWSYFAPSPYVGVGIVTPKTGESGLRMVPSLHIGLEAEFSKSFAIGIDAVARKVTRLADGYSIGSPVTSSTAFTQDRYEWGWSLTFSVSPEFFQFTVGKP